MKWIVALLVCLWLSAAAAAPQYTVSERTGKKLSRVQELMEAEQIGDAKRILDGLNTGRMSEYERALVFQFLAFIAHGQDDAPGAIRYFEKCLAEEALPPQSQLQLRFSLAQLYMGLEKWDLAISNLERWFKEAGDPNSIAYYTLAVAYYQKGDKDKALEPARKAYELKKNPKESWISLLLALYLERSEYEPALPLLEELVLLSPKRVYWMQLGAIYAELGQDEKSLAVQQLAYAKGYLEADGELRQLARLYLYHDLPYRAAQVMDKSLREEKVEADAEALELLGQSWMAAREFDKALDPMARAAALSKDGELWLRLGQVHVERDDWKQASVALRSAIEKGDFEELGTAHLLFGIAAYNQDQLDTARKSFSKAAKHDSTKKDALRWIQHIERQAKRDV